MSTKQVTLQQVFDLVEAYITQSIPGEHAVHMDLTLSSSQHFTSPIRARMAAPAVVEDDEAGDMEVPTSLDELTDMQAAILQALADGPLKGAELARKSGYAEKSIGRGGVEPRGELRAWGFVRNTARGYELTDAGHDLVA